MTWFDVDPMLRKRVQAGEAPAMKVYCEQYLFKPNSIDVHYTADSTQWFARVKSRMVSVPPPIDGTALATIGHEVGHVILGVCPNTGPHIEVKRHRTLVCLECERKAWALAERMLPPFTSEMHQYKRRALGSYRTTARATPEAQNDADRDMGTVQWAQR